MRIKYKCTSCRDEIEQGQFMAVIGRAPAAGLSTPMGRADRIMREVGSLYCADCFRERSSVNFIAQVNKKKWWREPG